LVQRVCEEVTQQQWTTHGRQHIQVKLQQHCANIGGGGQQQSVFEETPLSSRGLLMAGSTSERSFSSTCGCKQESRRSEHRHCAVQADSKPQCVCEEVTQQQGAAHSWEDT
jgi:activator of HSP90 ATPase